MPDSFIDPQSQASLDRLLAGLQAKQAELEDILAGARQSVAELQGASREAVAQQQSQARELSGSRPAGRDAGTIEQGSAALRDRIALERELQGLIENRIRLETEAATAAGHPAGAGAAQAATEARLTAQGGVLFGGVGQAAAGAGQADATAKLSAEQARLLATAQQGAAASRLGADAESNFGAATERNVLLFSQSDNALQRHGALTTEFIRAAAQGEVTLREFGDQIGATIGKFAGWTAAAAAVYGTLGAVTELARGAIDSTNAVGQLHRTIEGFDTGQANQALIGLAHDTNVSMKEAGDAVFQLSRTFHSVGDAVTVARLALMAYQLDGVAVADSVKSVTAIHQQFRVTAEGMVPVFDELAAGQREFNARMTDQIPALQRSAAAIKNAGGNLREFIELTTLAIRTTQLSGAQIGTAFSRSAANFLTPSTAKGQADRAVLSSLGINPNQSYTQVIIDAVKHSATLSDSQRQELAHAIFGPLRGGLLAGLFTGDAPQLLDEIQKKLAPGQVQGSFLSEFSKFLNTSSQELKALVNNLQQLGAELGQSGLLTPLGLAVKGANDLLHVSTQVLGIWSKLPGPVREAAGLFAAFAASRALATRFNVGIPGLGPSAEARGQTQLQTGLGLEQDYFTGQYRGTLRSASTAALATDAAERARNEAVAGGTQAQQIAAQKAYEAALAKQVQLENEAAALQQQTLTLKARINQVQAGINSGLSAEAAATAAGIDYRLATSERGVIVPNAVAPVSPEARAASASGQLALFPAGAANDMQALEEKAGKAAAQTQSLESAWTRAGGAVGGAVRAVPGATSAIGAGATAFETAGGAMGGLTGKLGGLVPSLLIFGFVAAQLADAQQQLDAAAQTVNADLARENQATNFDQLSQSLQTTRQALQKQKDKIEQGPAAGIPILGPLVGALSNAVGAQHADPFGAYTAYDRNARLQSEQAQYAKDFERMADVIRGDAATAGKTLPARNKFYAELNSLKEKAAQFARGAPGAAAPLATLNNVLQQIYENFQQSLKPLTVGSKDPFAQFKTESTTAIVSQMQAVSDRLKIYGPDSTGLAQLATAYAFLAKKYSFSQDDKGLQAVSQAQSLFVETVRKDAQDLIDQAGVAGTAGERNALLGQARSLISSAKGQLAAADAALHSQLGTLQAAEDADIRTLATTIEVIRSAHTSTERYILEYALNLQGMYAKVAQDANAIKQARNELANVDKANQQINSQLDQTLKSINTAQTGASDPFELTRLRRELQQARDQGDPVRSAQDAERLARDEINAAQTEKDRLQGQIDLANAENQLNKAISDRSQAYYSYLEASTQDPVKQAGIEILAASKAISDAVANSGAGSQAYFEALQKYADAQSKLAKSLEDRKQAYYTLLESETQDPVKQSAIAVTAAAEAVNNAAAHGGTNTQDYYQAKAKLNDARQKHTDAVISNREDDIKFYLDMGQISTETAIREYRALLSMHNLTKKTRQQILEQIHQLQTGTSDGFSDLNLGSIRLPTPYEIRRAVMVAGAQGGNAITQYNDVTIQTTDSRQVVEALGSHIERRLSQGARAHARAMGRR